MEFIIHPHARDRMNERGVSETEVKQTLIDGERFLAKLGRTGFRRNFRFDAKWRDRSYAIKQIEVYAVCEAPKWVVITVLAHYF
jgi:hypothetical protein